MRRGLFEANPPPIQSLHRWLQPSATPDQQAVLHPGGIAAGGGLREEKKFKALPLGLRTTHNALSTRPSNERLS